MIHSPTAHACAVLSDLTEKLAAARRDEKRSADRIAALDAELVLCAARLACFPAPRHAAGAHRRALLGQRLTNLGALRAALIAERARRRRLIDDIAQRREAIEAALAFLREQAQGRVAAAR